MLLKGIMFITDNLDIIYNSPINRNNKIVSIDEDGILDNIEGIVGGTCLLPPIEAKIAEADGNEQLYDSIYSDHLLKPSQQYFISALIAFLYKGGNLILFLPEIGYTNTKEKLIQHLFGIYGIHPGMIGNQNPQYANCYYDEKCIPVWLNLIFMADVIGPEEYLLNYPEDAIIFNEQVINKLVELLKPYGNTIAEQRDYIFRFHKLIHKNNNIKQAIIGDY